MARPTRRPGESSPQALYQLGVQGRKTGATLKDDGKRDSQGMMPTAGLFSSPGGNTTQNVAVAPTEDPIPEVTPSPERNEDASVPMDIASSGGAGPATVLRESRNFKMPLPKGRSPAKTNASLLRSPAKRNPNISPMPPAEPSARFLDFPTPSRRSQGSRRPSTAEIPSSDSINALMGQAGELGDATPVQTDYRHVNEYIPRQRPRESAIGMSAKARGKQRAAPSRSPPQQLPEEPSIYVQDPETEPEPELGPGPEPGPEPELEPAIELEPPQYSSSPPAPIREPLIAAPSPRPPTKRPTPALSTTGSTARRPRNDGDDHRDGAKRQRQTGSEVSRRSEQPVKRGRGRPPKNGVAKRGRGRPRRSEVESDGEEGESLMTLQRGPPMPKSRGLVSMRRDAAAAAQNRHRGNDADWWADLQNDDSVYQHEQPRGQGLASQTTTRQRRQPAAAAAIADEDAELEDWEVDPGSLTGEIVLWEPEHEHNPPGPDDPVQVTDERIAVTADAIQTYEIRDSDARYAKPLTMPFMGAGLVDLPPHSEKRPKNSRKMHLVFFVHYGKVTVNINDAQFRISAGGMWFVPRGNYYNIANELDFPARVYFAQACEVSPTPQPVDDMTQTIMA